MIKEKWKQRAKREKQIIGVGSVLTVILIIYGGLYLPFTHHVDFLRTQIKEDGKLLAFMQQTDQAIDQVGKVGQTKMKPASPVMLLALLQKQITASALNGSLTQLKQGVGDTVIMHFHKVEFDRLMQLLTTVMKHHNLVIMQMSSKANGELGLIDVEMVVGLSN